MLESGQAVADYQIVTPLAENQLYQSYLAKTASGEEIQLLLLSADSLAADDLLSEFLDQAKILKSKSFPGINGLLTAEIIDDYVCVTFPALAGTTMPEALGVSYTIRDALELFKQLVDLLMPVHEAGFRHGNITAETAVVVDNRINIDQFSLATLLPLDFNSGIDPQFSSPEIVRGEDPGVASDLYSLGILLHLLLCGKVPFSSDDSYSTALQHVQEQVPRLPDGLIFCQPILDGLLHALPAERLTITELSEQLAELMVLAELDQLVPFERPLPISDSGEADSVSRQSSIEKLMVESDIAARIEERLTQRADILNQGREEIPNASRANSSRIVSLGQKDSQDRPPADNASQKYRQSNGSSRLFVLVAVGIIVGVILYFLFFAQQLQLPKSEAGLPVKLQQGLTLGSQQLSAGDADTAEQTFLALAHEFPFSPQPYNNLAAVYASNGDLERSRSYLEKALATDEAYVVVYRNLAAIYAEMARDSYVRALQMEEGEQAVALQLFAGDQLVAVNTTIPATKVLPADGIPVTAAREKTSTQGTAVEQVSAFQPPVAAAEEAVVTATESAVTATEPAVSATEPAVSVTEPAVSVTEPVVATTDAALEVVSESPEAFLQRWAESWSAQDVASYLSFYAVEFLPASGKSRAAWEQRRKSRLTRPAEISIELADFEILSTSAEQLEVQVNQRYRSDRYADHTRKLFVLQPVANSWKILSERSLGRVR